MRVLGNRNYHSLIVGYLHTCAITGPGITYCWGFDSAGQLGNGISAGDQTTPDLVSGQYVFATLSAGGNHTCGVTTQDEAFCWGDNFARQLGDGGIVIDRSSPFPVVPPESLVSIFCP